MNKRFARNIVGVVVALGLAGPTAAQTAKKSRTTAPLEAAADPLQEFEKIVQQCQAAAKTAISVYYNSKISSWVRKVSKFEVRYDVRKTDSLVTPFVGQINILEISAAERAADEQSATALDFTIDSSRNVRTRIAVTFNWREQKWTFKDGTSIMDFSGESGMYDGPIGPIRSVIDPSKGTAFYGPIADCFPS